MSHIVRSSPTYWHRHEKAIYCAHCIETGIACHVSSIMPNTESLTQHSDSTGAGFDRHA